MPCVHQVAQHTFAGGSIRPRRFSPAEVNAERGKLEMPPDASYSFTKYRRIIVFSLGPSSAEFNRKNITTA